MIREESMSACLKLQPLLSRVAEGEANPEEAMLTARHLSDCTACRIVLARERRLAEALERDLNDPVQVGEEFVQTVMANLPKEPPPRRRRNKKLRAVKLAGLAGILATLSHRTAEPVGSPTADGFWPVLPQWDPIAPAFAFEGAPEAGGVLVLALDALLRGLPVTVPSFGGTLAVALAVLPLAAATLLTAVSLLALATRGSLRPR